MSANQNEPSKDNTGTPDIAYNLVSTIYHALQGAETEARYIADAEATGDEETIKFFRNLKQENGRRADDAKRLLAKNLGQQQGQSAKA
jgi:type IV secretory pathway ATPase VirB11/archaellum biosynthesis ATPase